MKVLVIGSGGREHAICWRLARSPSVKQLYCAPGNPGTAALATNVPIGVDNQQELVAFARKETIDLTVVGPEAPLCTGIQRRFAEAGLLLFGPSLEAARLEGSKVFSKQFMREHDIPTAAFDVFDDAAAALAYIADHDRARVVKADGLAAGKGVFVASSEDEAREAVRALLTERTMGDAGRRILVEERLQGEEVSVIAIADGERVLTLASSQDHKPVFDGDKGPNTGGMGAYSPAPVLDDALQARVKQEVLLPTVAGMAAAGHPFRGVLYAGLMIVDGDPYVLEYNCRFGDPEAQPLMARFDDDLVPYLVGAAQGRLPQRAPKWDLRAALCVVMTAGGYPGGYARGEPIDGIDKAQAFDDVLLFQAGTATRDDGQLVTSGGRVLGVTALGTDLQQAQRRAYQAVDCISWKGVHFRRDIGHRGLGPA